MKKQDLKNGAVVVTRNGGAYIKVNSTLLHLRMDGSYLELKEYYDDLKRKNNYKSLDIMKVYNDVLNAMSCHNKAVFNYHNGNKYTWRRIEILDSEEKKYLSQVIRPFRNNVSTIKKEYSTALNRCFIKINMNRENYYNCIKLPDFKENTMYKGMEIDRGYTLEELGI